MKLCTLFRKLLKHDEHPNTSIYYDTLMIPQQKHALLCCCFCVTSIFIMIPYNIKYIHLYNTFRINEYKYWSYVPGFVNCWHMTNIPIHLYIMTPLWYLSKSMPFFVLASLSSLLFIMIPYNIKYIQLYNTFRINEYK